jgi:hypothetical protein
LTGTQSYQFPAVHPDAAPGQGTGGLYRQADQNELGWNSYEGDARKALLDRNKAKMIQLYLG